jgi:hypothetical protein
MFTRRWHSQPTKRLGEEALSGLTSVTRRCRTEHISGRRVPLDPLLGEQFPLPRYFLLTQRPQYRIRNRLLSGEVVPNDDNHTLHCVDYLREQVMCHGDLTLESTKNYYTFDTNYGHSCRDHSALKEWIDRHKWAGHKEYIAENLGLKFKESQVDMMGHHAN